MLIINIYIYFYYILLKFICSHLTISNRARTCFKCTQLLKNENFPLLTPIFLFNIGHRRCSNGSRISSSTWISILEPEHASRTPDVVAMKVKSRRTGWDRVSQSDDAVNGNTTAAFVINKTIYIYQIVSRLTILTHHGTWRGRRAVRGDASIHQTRKGGQGKIRDIYLIWGEWMNGRCGLSGFFNRGKWTAPKLKG